MLNCNTSLFEAPAVVARVDKPISNVDINNLFLKGVIDDEINVLLAATAWNLKQWIIAFLCLLFALYYRLFSSQADALFLCLLAEL